MIKNLQVVLLQEHFKLGKWCILAFLKYMWPFGHYLPNQWHNRDLINNIIWGMLRPFKWHPIRLDIKMLDVCSDQFYFHCPALMFQSVHSLKSHKVFGSNAYFVPLYLMLTSFFLCSRPIYITIYQRSQAVGGVHGVWFRQYWTRLLSPASAKSKSTAVESKTGFESEIELS